VPIVVWWLLFVVVIGAWARNRGRSFLIWAVLALIFSPILAAIVLIVLVTRQRGAIARLTRTLDDWLNRKSREIRQRRNEAAELEAGAEAEKRREMVDQIISACAAEASRKSPSPTVPTSPQDFQPGFGTRAVAAP
jgi:ABC-type multidrug transport system fused ATPase/permease subunit